LVVSPYNGVLVTEAWNSSTTVFKVLLKLIEFCRERFVL
jgi:hypothetical protein